MKNVEWKKRKEEEEEESWSSQNRYSDIQNETLDSSWKPDCDQMYSGEVAGLLAVRALEGEGRRAPPSGGKRNYSSAQQKQTKKKTRWHPRFIFCCQTFEMDAGTWTHRDRTNKRKKKRKKKKTSPVFPHKLTEENQKKPV